MSFGERSSQDGCFSGPLECIEMVKREWMSVVCTCIAKSQRKKEPTNAEVVDRKWMPRKLGTCTGVLYTKMVRPYSSSLFMLRSVWLVGIHSLL